MLKRANRLPSFVRFTSARTTRFPLVTIKQQVASSPLSRASVVVSRRVSPSAVERNRIKRQIHTCLYLSLPHWKSSHDLLVIINPAAKSVTSDALRQEITTYLQKLSL